MQTRLHLAALAIIGVLALLPATAAAQSRFVYTTAGQNGPQPSEIHETTAKLVYEFYDNKNTSIGTATCPRPGNCLPRFPAGTAKYSVVLEFDAARDEFLSESCNGVPSTVLQGQCIDGPLQVTLRARWGTLIYHLIPDARVGRNLPAPRFPNIGTGVRFESNTDATKYWDHPSSRLYQPGGGYAMAVGSYKLRANAMSGPCKPVHTNPDDIIDVRDGQVTEFTVRYTGTMCTMSIKSWSQSPTDAGTFSSLPAGLSCGANANPATCKAEFPFDSTVRLIANPASGYTTSFDRNFTGCSRDEPDRTVCEILADGDRELSASFYATTTPPPAPPLDLAFAATASAPSEDLAAKGMLGVPMLQLTATVQNGAAKLQALTVKASGSGRDDLDLVMVKVVLDANGNGVFDAGETVLAQGRPAADNGELRLGLGTELIVAETTRLLVVADIDNEVRSASAAALGGATLALAMGLFAMPASRRRWHVPATLALIVMTCLLLKGCGGGDSESEEAPIVDVPPVLVPPADVPPPVLLTYRLDLIAVEANDSATPAAPLTILALPVLGTNITVQQ